MDFFKNTMVRIIAWICLIVSAVILILGGATQEDFSSVLAMVIGIVSAISSLIVLIGNLVKKTE